MNRITLLLMALAAFLAGCGSVPPAPTDWFYRLQPVVVAPGKAPPGAIAVQPFRADSLYAERPIVYADESSLRQLRQYHYHLWLYPPAQMVQGHLLASLGSWLDLNGGSDAPYSLDGRVLGFERVLSGKRSKASVSVELRLSAKGAPVLGRIYQAESLAADDSMAAFAVAMEQALAGVYTEFLADAARVR